ncbi:MAG: glycosyl hydrolase [Marinilabiliales bacterium]|nr:MAG: glycosyl hydrolase [Marinilabiliales bacterium]
MKNLVLSISFIAVLCCFNSATSQELLINGEPKWFIMMQDPAVNFYDVQREANAYFETIGTGKGTMYKIYKRWEYMNFDRTFPTGERPRQDHLWNEMKKFNAIHPPRSGRESNWEEIGPRVWQENTGHWNPGIGRINVVAVDPNDPNTIYIGAPSGGCWKTTNEGETWEVLTDHLPVMGVSAIAIDYTDTDVIYIGTGDRDAADNYSIGVLKSTDGGQNWETTGMQHSIYQNLTVEKLLIHPDDPNIIYCAVNNGLYRSYDGADSWEEILSGHIDDIEFKPGDPSTIYALTKKFYKSTDGGDSFTQITAGLPANNGRAQIAVTNAEPDYVYFMCAGTDGLFGGVYRSTNSGDSFELRADSPQMLGYSPTGNDNSSQSSYDLGLAVSHLNPEEVHLLGIITWRSLDGGVNWVATTEWNFQNDPIGYTHCDMHWAHFEGGTLYVGSDGLVCKSEDSGNTWVDMTTGIGIRQFYRIGGSKNHPYKLIGGSQDNGTSVYTTDYWHEWLGADGMECLVDYSNENIVYGTIQFGNFYKSSNGGMNTVNINQPGSGDWVTPFVIHPTNPQTIFVGTNNGIRKTTNGMQSWTTISDFSNTVRQMAISESNPDYIFASWGSTIKRTKDGGDSWSDVSDDLPANAISYIAVHPSNPELIAVSLSGYDEGEKIYISEDAGDTWTNYSLNLPNIPANCLAFYDDPAESLYVGMDVGVYYIDNTLDEYETFWEGLPNVIVNELEINYQINKIRAATFGRGLWESDVRMMEPVSEFEADHTMIPTGHFVNFYSLASGPPAIFEWTFEGGTPSTSTEKDPTNIIYENEGSFNVTLTVTNDMGTSTITKENYITVSSSLLPEVDFRADANAVCLGEEIILTDQTAYFPLSWNWEITPGTFTFTNGTNASSQNPVILCSEYGHYSVTLTASNSNGESSLTKTDFLSIGGYSLPFNEDFESIVLDEAWTIENPNNNETWEMAEVGGNSPGNKAARVNFREIFAIGQTDNLISQPLDLTEYAEAYLYFEHAYAKYYQEASDSLIIYISIDCGENWTRIFEGGDDGFGSFATHPLTEEGFIPEAQEDWCGAGYGSDCNTIDISEWAGQKEVKIKFGTYSFYGNPIYVDNVMVGNNPYVVVDETKISKVAIYPNPNSGIFNLKLNNVNTSVQVIITNMTGQVVYSSFLESKETQIDLAGHPAGIYLVNISGGTFNEQIKIIKD